jgi:hypothetical protein
VSQPNLSLAERVPHDRAGRLVVGDYFSCPRNTSGRKGELGTKGPPEGCRRVKSDTLLVGIVIRHRTWLRCVRSSFGFRDGYQGGEHHSRRAQTGRVIQSRADWGDCTSR